MSKEQYENDSVSSGAIEFYKRVARVQSDLVAAKSQFNSFGKYNYRNCEDILNGFKNLNSGLVLTITDDVIVVQDRFYIKATATISDGIHAISNTGLAREALTKKGMDDSQVSGAASSYARKYALGGLLCVDDTKDADSRAPVKNVSKDQLAGISDLIGLTMSDIAAVKSHYKVNDLKDLTEDQAAHLESKLKMKLIKINEQ